MYHEEGAANKAPINKKIGFFLISPTTDITSELIVTVQNSVDSTLTPPLPYYTTYGAKY